LPHAAEPGRSAHAAYSKSAGREARAGDRKPPRALTLISRRALGWLPVSSAALRAA